MRIVVIGGGPGGLYAAILLKKGRPSAQVTVLERNRPDDTFGFGVVFSDATLEDLATADAPSYEAITRCFYHWDDIHIHYRGERISSTGHGFAGMSRHTLLRILQNRARQLGVEVEFEQEVVDASTLLDVDLVVASDGVNSGVRERFAAHFRPRIDERPNRFVWLGTSRPFPAFTFFFKENEHGLWRVHAYQYDVQGNATFIVETTEEAWRAAGLAEASEAETLHFCQALFSEELEGHRLIGNRSIWRRFPTVRNERWHHENLVLIGDAAHTAHFSVGSGTRLAMMDAIALKEALENHGLLGREGEAYSEEASGDATASAIRSALADYEAARRPGVESIQRAAQASLQWFEDTERYMELEPLQFAFALLTRSLRISHENLRARDPELVFQVDAWYARQAARQSGTPVRTDPPPPPLFTPFRLRGLVVPNRVVVSPMCQYSARDGTPGDWHLVHLGSRAVGGAGLVFVEMTDVSAEARISPGCVGLYRPEHVPAWRRIVDFIHRNSEAKVAVQLGHAGRKGSTRRLWEGDARPLPEGNWPILSASPIPYFPESQVPKALDRTDMDALIGDYVRAAGMALEAGFDLLEVHMAHGYLLASFISPLTNERSDEYGGSLENRMRFPLEVFDAVREVWPEDRPMSVRISAVDWAPGGLEPEDAVMVARMLEAHGCDVVDVSSGQTVPHQRPVYGRQYQTPFADRIRHEVGIATMAVGNISSYEDVNSILAAGRADLCLLARAHLWDPYWTRHAAYELGHPLPWPPQYATLDRYTPRFSS